MRETAGGRSGSEAIEFRDVRAVLGGQVILDGVSFTARQGEFLCLLGPSGSGKSTTLRIIGGLLKSNGGKVRVLGAPPDEGWRRLAFVFQSPRLVPWRTALENVVLGMELRLDDERPAEMEARARQYLAMVGLAADARKFPAQLSGGERQRVALARALAVEPEIILMDEPFSALDITTRERLRDEVIRIWRSTGKTILFVTHDLDEALYLSDRVIIISDKPARVMRIIEPGMPRPRNLFSDPEIARLRSEMRELFRGIRGMGELLEEERRG
jgi:NitT/TauT family transport system ATP-binding protein